MPSITSIMMKFDVYQNYKPSKPKNNKYKKFEGGIN